MLSDKVIIKKSSISGKGVFALKEFKKGEIVLHWDTRNILSKEQVEKLSEKDQNYISFVDGMYIFMQNPERFINHSCSANTTVHNFCDVAIRDIKRGEEVTANYKEVMESGESMLCNCKSKKCKQIISV